MRFTTVVAIMACPAFDNASQLALDAVVFPTEIVATVDVVVIAKVGIGGISRVPHRLCLNVENERRMRR